MTKPSSEHIHKFIYFIVLQIAPLPAIRKRLRGIPVGGSREKYAHTGESGTGSETDGGD